MSDNKTRAKVVLRLIAAWLVGLFGAAAFLDSATHNDALGLFLAAGIVYVAWKKIPYHPEVKRKDPERE